MKKMIISLCLLLAAGLLSARNADDVFVVLPQPQSAVQLPDQHVSDSPEGYVLEIVSPNAISKQEVHKRF